MRNTYIATLAVLISAGILAVNFLPLKEKYSSILHDQAASLSVLLPSEASTPIGTAAESSPPFTQSVPSNVRPVTATPLVSPPVQVQPPSSSPVSQQPSETGMPVSYIYFFTGVPTRSAPMTTIVCSGGFTQSVPVSTSQMMPVVRQYSLPVFVPQVIPSRMGAPKLVYTNGVVIKPKVYYPRQPLRNSIRGVTP